jgi:ribosomal-protein-alanine N-acetyltransferase
MGELALRHSRIYTVAGIDGAVVGFGGLLLTGADAHITTIAVDPEWRRHGVASRMMVLLARQAAGRGAQNMTLEVRATNDGAQALYSRFGLEPAGLRKNYYSDLKEDAVVMWALDIGSEAYASRLDVIAEGLAGSVALEGWA